MERIRHVGAKTRFDVDSAPEWAGVGSEDHRVLADLFAG